MTINWAHTPITFKKDDIVFRTCTNFEEAHTWLKSTADKILQLTKSFPQNYHSMYNNRWQNVSNTFNTIRTKSNDSNISTMLDSYISYASEFLSIFDGIKGPAIDNLVDIYDKRGPLVAAAYWSYYSKIEWNGPLSGNVFDGYSLAATALRNHELDISSVASNTMDSVITNLHGVFEGWNSPARKLSEETMQALNRHLESIDSYQANAQRWLKDFYGSAITEKDRLVSSASNELESITKAYDSQMALQAPTKYWRDRARKHHNRAFWFFIALVGTMSCAILIVSLLSIVLILPVEKYIAYPLLVHDSSAGSQFAKIAGFTAILAIIYWILRIVSRNLLSNQHIAADADERRVMVMTYLALLRKDKLVDNDTLPLILASLFRPGTDGLIKEDSGPNPIIIDAVNALKK